MMFLEHLILNSACFELAGQLERIDFIYSHSLSRGEPPLISHRHAHAYHVVVPFVIYKE
jgi:hypothetical protein